MKPPDPYLPQVLLSAYFGITILFSIIRSIRCTHKNATKTTTDPHRDAIRKRIGRTTFFLSRPGRSPLLSSIRKHFYHVSVLTITRLACIITITRMAMIEAGTSIIKNTCSIFYDGVIDPISTRSIPHIFAEYVSSEYKFKSRYDPHRI